MRPICSNKYKETLQPRRLANKPPSHQATNPVVKKRVGGFAKRLQYYSGGYDDYNDYDDSNDDDDDDNDDYDICDNYDDHDTSQIIPE